MTQTMLMPCAECGANLPGEDALRRHEEQAHSEQPEIRCRACGWSFFNDDDLEQHRRELHAA
jgi:hypothetical protein